MYVRKKSLGSNEIDWKNALLAHDQYFTTFCKKETWTYLKCSDWKCLENRSAGSWLILMSLNAEILDLETFLIMKIAYFARMKKNRQKISQKIFLPLCKKGALFYVFRWSLVPA